MYRMTPAEAARIAFYIGYHSALGHIVHVMTVTVSDTRRILLHIFDEKGEFADPIVLFSLPLSYPKESVWQYEGAVYDMLLQVKNQFPSRHVV